MAENVEALGFELEEEHMEKINALDGTRPGAPAPVAPS
jgi:diketogulonate reductase-like aldo/keto reductase